MSSRSHAARAKWGSPEYREKMRAAKKRNDERRAWDVADRLLSLIAGCPSDGPLPSRNEIGDAIGAGEKVFLSALALLEEHGLVESDVRWHEPTQHLRRFACLTDLGRERAGPVATKAEERPTYIDHPDTAADGSGVIGYRPDEWPRTW